MTCLIYLNWCREIPPFTSKKPPFTSAVALQIPKGYHCGRVNPWCDEFHLKLGTSQKEGPKDLDNAYEQ